MTVCCNFGTVPGTKARKSLWCSKGEREMASFARHTAMCIVLYLHSTKKLSFTGPELSPQILAVDGIWEPMARTVNKNGLAHSLHRP